MRVVDGARARAERRTTLAHYQPTHNYATTTADDGAVNISVCTHTRTHIHAVPRLSHSPSSRS